MTNAADFKRPLWDGICLPPLIRGLPEIDIPVAGVRGWLLQGGEQQAVFFDIEPIGAIPPHSHGEQWGVVLAGEMNLTVGGETKRMGPGDWYHIPARVVHSAEFLSRFQAIDFFADRDRWRAKDKA